MKRFKKIGVFLKNGPIDEAVLAFASHVAQFDAEEIFCIHVNPTAGDATHETIDSDAFESRVRSALPSSIADRTHCNVLEGDHLEQVLRSTRDLDLDLAIIGRKLPSSQLGVGNKITRIARKSPCCVLVVPELCQPHFGRILVAVDCSNHSRLAMETAIALATASGEPHPQLIALTVRQVSSRYDLAGVTFQESADAQRNYGLRDLEKFLSGINARKVAIEPLVVLSEEPALAMTHVAMAKKMDIVVIGSRGATTTAAALLGSTSEKLLLSCAMPVLIVKEKGETLHFLEALFSTG